MFVFLYDSWDCDIQDKIYTPKVNVNIVPKNQQMLNNTLIIY